ncbi:MAG: hypothetical protein WBY44_11285 [Bryobacteraceae bacterium]
MLTEKPPANLAYVAVSFGGIQIEPFLQSWYRCFQTVGGQIPVDRRDSMQVSVELTDF